MRSKKLVSVIIPVFNGEKYLAESIESALAQSYRPFEIILVDDGSTDGSASIANSYADVRYIYQYNQGVSAARNTGLAAASGTFIAFLDADDIWHPQKLQIQIEYLCKHPSVMYTITRVKNFLEPGLNIHPQMLQSILQEDKPGYATIVARKKVFDQIGGFNPCYQVSEDFEWMIRAKDAGIPMVILPAVLLQRRIHKSNMTITQSRDCKANRLQIIKESLDRQRKKKVGKGGMQ